MKFLRSLLSVALAFLIVILGLVVFANYSAYIDELEALATPSPTLPPYDPDEFTTPPVPETTEPPVEAPSNTIGFTLAYAGDVVCHSGLNSEADNGTDYDYTTILSGSTAYVTNADYSVCCLETTFPETSDYTGYPMFKSPKGLATSLKNTGFDLISTASNHCMDSYQAGIIATLDTLDANGLDHVGTYRTQEERDANNGIVVKDINGISVAFLAFTYGTNGLPMNGFEYAANVFYNDYVTTLTDINYDILENDMAAARALNTDLIVVFMHWGYEYFTEPVAYQEELADLMFSLGADIILGGHVHVPEPMEIRTVIDVDGNEKTGYLCYCLGNYISCQDDHYTNLTAVVHLEIEKDLDTGNTYLKNFSYAPMFMVDLNDYDIYDAGWRYRLWDLNGAITSYEGGDNLGVINNALYDALKLGLDDIHSIFGSQYDMFSPDYSPNLVGEMPVPAADE